MNAKMCGISPNVNINSLYQKAIVNKVSSDDWYEKKKEIKKRAKRVLRSK
jgi:hypothetical protein